MTFIRRIPSSSDNNSYNDQPVRRRDKAKEALNNFFNRSPHAEKEVADTKSKSAKLFEEMRRTERRTKGPQGGLGDSVKHFLRKTIIHTNDPTEKVSKISKRFSGLSHPLEEEPDFSGGQLPKTESTKSIGSEEDTSSMEINDLSQGQSPKYENLKSGGHELIIFNQQQIRDLKNEINVLRNNTDPESHQKIEQHKATINQKSYEVHVILCNLRGVTPLSEKDYFASHQIIDDDDDYILA